MTVLIGSGFFVLLTNAFSALIDFVASLANNLLAIAQIVVENIAEWAFLRLASL